MAVRLRRRRLARRVLVVLALLPLLAVVYLSTAGFPRWTIKRIARAADERGFCLELGGMRLDLLRGGVSLARVKVFKKGIIGQPVFEAGHVGIVFSLVQGRGAGRLRSIRVVDGRLRRDAGGEMQTPAAGAASREPASVRLTLENCDLQCLWLSRFQCNLGLDASGMRLENVKGVAGVGAGSGPFEGEFAFQSGPGSYRGRVVSAFDPNELTPFLTVKRLDGLVGVIESFSFPGPPPRIEAEFSGTTGPRSTVLVEARFRGRGFRRNLADVVVADGAVTVDLGPDRQTVTIAPLRVRRTEGVAKAGLTVDMMSRTVQFFGSSTIDLRAVAQMVHPAGPGLLQDLDFGGAVTGVVNGLVSYADAGVCGIHGQVDAAALGMSGFSADACSFNYNRNGRTNDISGFRAAVFGGTLTGSAVFGPDGSSTNTRFSVAGSLLDADFGRLSRRFSGDLKSGTAAMKGLLSCDIQAEGVAGPGMKRSLRGRGQIKVRDGNILQLPLFGGLSDVLVRTVPGLGYILRQSSADGSFEIRDGRIWTRDLRIEGEVLSLKADGSYDMVADNLDFDVELRFLKKKTWVGDILQTIMLPVTKLFRIRLRGPLGDPKWESVNF